MTWQGFCATFTTKPEEMKPVYLLFILVLLPSCWPCDPVIIDLGDVPDDGIAFVPYLPGETISLEHSEGLTITYSIQRESRDEETWCEWCCKNIYRYEVLTTKLTPNYPTASIEITMNSSDSTFIPCSVYTDGGYFIIPTNKVMPDYDNKLDSIQIGLETYYDVFLLETDSWNKSDGEIYADSLYYNFEFGILKLTKTNDEYFQLVQ